ncbi:unnamed protein product, partial [Laminaria digitata]
VAVAVAGGQSKSEPSNTHARARPRMILCRRPCRLIATTTLLAVRCCRGYLTPPLPSSCMLVTLSRRRPLTTAFQHLSLPRQHRSLSTSLAGARAPMVGPALPPAPPPAPVFDADGNELSKPTKRKVAIVVGYVGTAFHGWQQSTDKEVRTVEGELETALWKAGAIADSNYGDLTKIGWGRTSRTDKGVHASKTVASAKLLLPQETFTAAGLSQYGKDTINKNLPDDIRCFSVSKVPKSFRGREECTLREYTYYLPKELLPNDEALEKFRVLLKHFVGTHSFHNYASTKGRQLKEVRKRVQASIDLKKAGGGGGGVKAAGGEGGDASSASPGLEGAGAEGGGVGEGGGEKRERPRDDWRTYRHKKKPAADRKQEDDWYGKSKASSEEVREGAGAEEEEAEPVPEKEKEKQGDGAGVQLSEAAPAVGGAEMAVEEAGGGGDADEAVVKGEDEGPEKVLLLRELRTSIYRCEALEGIVSYTREGQEVPDEFVRIDIRGKAFVYNQIRLMIGGALGEARGDLMPGFVDAALKTPYKLRVPLAPAEGLVLESQ